MVHKPEQRTRPAAAVDWIVAVGIGIASLGLYLATLAPTILGGDAGEFQFVPPLLGVAHPTGYPLYVLLGWVWTHLLPIGEVAFRMNLFSAVTAAAAVGIFYLAALTFLRHTAGEAAASTSPPAPPAFFHRVAAALAAVTLAVTPTLWSQAVIAEVYGLHTLLVALLFYLLLLWGRRRDRHTLYLAALVFGLGLAHHRTTLLLAPAVLAYVWLTDRATLRDGRILARAALLVLLPQLLYLLIPLRAPHTPYLHLSLTPARELVLYENTPASFFDFVLGGPFGGSLDLSVDLGERVAMAAGLLRAEIGWAGMALAAAGAVWLALARRTALLLFTGLAYAATVAFNLVYTIGDIFVLFIPSYAVLALWIGLGACVLATLVARAIRHLAGRPIHTGRVALLVVLPLFLLPLWLAATNYREVDRSASTSARNGWYGLLSLPETDLGPPEGYSGPPHDAVLVSDDRNDIMPLWYLQYIDGVRPDLLGLFPLITQEQPSLGHVLDLALSTQRPVYLIKEMPGIEVKVDVDTGSDLWRVLGPAVRGDPPYALGATLDGRIALAGYDRAPRAPRPGETLHVSLVWDALAGIEVPYQSYVHLVDSAGQVLAQSDHRPGEIFYPTTQWRPGERLRDKHALDVPSDTAPGVYTLVAGMYLLGADGVISALGDPIALGSVAVQSSEASGILEPEHLVGVSFGEEIELTGYDATVTDGTLVITLHWCTIQPPVSDYTVFVHLLDAGGQIVAQDDAPPQGGTYPTTVWDSGEVVVDPHRLSLPSGVSAAGLDNHQLRIGLYHSETGDRLPAAAGGDNVTLTLPALP